MNIREHVPISELTTMRLGGEADAVVEVEKLEDVSEVIEIAERSNVPTWFMGGGANTIGHDEGFRGIIIVNKLRGLEVVSEDENSVTIKGMAGETWDDVVEFACKKNLSGIEAMSMIPGTLGAAPVQNIGAYGQDIGNVIVSVEAYDTRTKEIVNLNKTDMGMTYRKTRFNTGEDTGRFFIISVTLRLRKSTMQPPFYNSLQRYVDEHKVTDFSPKNIRKMVCELRKSKLPDPKEIASSGSFFKNVYLNQVEADEAEERGIPVWRSNDDSGKINAGWLIENCGLKGKTLHGFKVSDKAALVLINESATSYEDLAKARQEIINTVESNYGFRLEQEPVEIPVEGAAGAAA